MYGRSVIDGDRQTGGEGGKVRRDDVVHRRQPVSNLTSPPAMASTMPKMGLGRRNRITRTNSAPYGSMDSYTCRARDGRNRARIFDASSGGTGMMWNAVNRTLVNTQIERNCPNRPTVPVRRSARAPITASTRFVAIPASAITV